MSADEPMACNQSEATSTSRLMSSDVNPEALTASLPGLAELAARVTACNKRRLTASDCQEGNRRDCNMSGNQTSSKEGGV